MSIDPATRAILLAFQKNEITEHHIYRRLSRIVKGAENQAILEKIANDEKQHYDIWRGYTGNDVAPDLFRTWKYYFIGRLFGITFSLKLMEKGEEQAQDKYRHLEHHVQEIDRIIADEETHEREVLALLDEELLQYTGSMVLGLNDALVELTGALAGFTLALRNTKLIALVGLVTGIAAALSMASSEYLSTKSEETERKPLKAAIYTGIAYIVTVFILITPYLVWKNYYACLGITLSAAVAIIFVFNYYIAVAKERPFMKHFLEMAFLSLGVAGVSFLIGYVLRVVFAVEV